MPKEIRKENCQKEKEPAAKKRIRNNEIKQQSNPYRDRKISGYQY